MSAPRVTPARDGCARATAAFVQPIAIVDDTGVARHPEVIGLPIAFPASAGLHSLDGFEVATLDGRALTTQLEVSSRWGGAPSDCGAPIRWAYAFVHASAATNERSYALVRHTPGHTPAPAAGLALTDDGRRIIVDTGAARFTVERTHFRGLSRVEVKTPRGFVTVAEVPPSGDAGLLLVANGEVAASAHAPAVIEVERTGPVVATIAARGAYAARDGRPVFDYAVRLSFFAGSGAVELDHTYYNRELTDHSARGGQRTRRIERVALRVPLVFGRATDVVARSHERLHTLRARRPVRVVQDKRTPERVDAVAAVLHGDERLELGTFADHPLVGATDGVLYALATIGFLAARDPQALAFDPAAVALDVEWQSEPLEVGGARGIWSRAVLDFGRRRGTDLGARGSALYAHATRRLVGVPSAAYLATTGVRSLPDGPLAGAFARFDRDLDRVHARTTAYLRTARITGTQLWPDLPRSICVGLQCTRYFEGGDANYWDWSLAELDAFVRTADPAFLHDFALAEAITMAETISFRPDGAPSKRRSSFAGFAPCYGPGRDREGAWREGLNHRLGNCPGDYSYNKVHQLAYVLTADRRFTDYFDEGAETAIALYGAPRSPPDRWLELSVSRTAVQYLELLLDAAELSRGDPAKSRRHREHVISYLRHMSTRALADGHTCELLGSRMDDPRAAGRCESSPGWMLAPWVDWITRVAALWDVPEAKRWLVAFARHSPRRHGLVDAEGAPITDSARWSTKYRCRADRGGIVEASCAPLTEGENGGRFYPNGAVAYLGALALALEADPSDPAHLCRWLPAAYARALDALDGQNNGWVWGKALGQAYAFAQRALGALSRCPP